MSPPQVPMPRRHSLACPRILEGLVLQPRREQAQLPPHREQALPVGAHEVGHRLVAQCVAMQPNAAVEGEAHPLAAAREPAVGWLYEQTIRPSVVAVPTGWA